MIQRNGSDNNGNHCHWKGERKKNEKKWEQFKRPLVQHKTHKYSHYRGPKRMRERKKGPEKLLKT